MQRRKVTLKLDPNAAQTTQLEAWARLHCELTDAALEERIGAWRKAGKSISYDDQQNALSEIKAARPEFVDLGSHALQQTLRRLDLAFAAFFRRIKTGQTPGSPRFKAAKRLTGFAYHDPSGWKLMEHGGSGATLRLGSGDAAMSIRDRYQAQRHHPHEQEWRVVRVGDAARARRELRAAARGRCAPTQTVAALLGVLGTHAQDPCRAHA